MYTHYHFSSITISGRIFLLSIESFTAFLRYLHFQNMYWCVISHLVIPNSLQLYELYPPKLLCPWNFPGKSTGMGNHTLLQVIFQAHGSNPLCCIFCIDKWIVYYNSLFWMLCFNFRFIARRISYIHKYIHFLRLSSHIDHYRVLSRVPCAIQQVLRSYPFYI